jgi:hypothetical protein
MASGAAKRYAQAVLSLAKEQGALDAWQRDLATLNNLMAEPRSVQYFTNPNVAHDEKRQVLAQTLADAQPQVRTWPCCCWSEAGWRSCRISSGLLTRPAWRNSASRSPR